MTALSPTTTRKRRHSQTQYSPEAPPPDNQHAMSIPQQNQYQLQIPQTQPANQLTRRQPNQPIIPVHDQGNGLNAQWQASNTGDGNLGTWPPVDDLDQRADAAKGDAESKRKQIPPFIQKLSSFLDQDQNNDLIQWSEGGDSFVVINEEDFAKKLLPELFKHSNYASFVRQLNMYGFHKKVGLSDNSMRASERKSKIPSEYSNPFFKRGRPNLLWLIQKPKNTNPKPRRAKQEASDEEVDEVFGRNSPLPGDFNVDDFTSTKPRQQNLLTLGNGSMAPSQDQLASVQSELQGIRDNQKRIAHMLNDVRREHQQLYGQAKFFQDLHQKHDDSINAILTFLASVYQKNINEMPPKDDNPRGGVLGEVREPSEELRPPLRKKVPLLLQDGSNAQWSPAYDTSHSPQVRELTPSPKLSPQERPPLTSQAEIMSMLKSQSGQSNAAFSPKSPQDRPSPASQADIMSMLKSQSAQNNAFSPTAPMDFSEAMQQLQSNGSTPLTPGERRSMLQLLGDDTSYPVNNDSVEQFNTSGQHIDQISQLLREQNQSIDDITNKVTPLSPSGSIPGLDIGNGGFGDPGLLDLEQIFDSGGYFNEGDGAANDFNFGDEGFDFGDAGGQGFGEGLDAGEERQEKGRAVTPSSAMAQAVAGRGDGTESPGKRRRIG